MGSKLNTGVITPSGCLKCPYHGLEYSSKSDTFGEIVEQDGKLFWAHNPIHPAPYRIPFYQNPSYVKSFLTIDMDASLTDSAFNTMDLRHPEYVHGGIGFGNAIPPENIREYKYSSEKVGLAFDYRANEFIRKINNNSPTTQNFHMFYYPGFSWSRVTFDRTNHLIIGVNLLPLENKKTRWYITIAHNYFTHSAQKEMMKLFAWLILTQDYTQMKNQEKETYLKKLVLFDHVFKNEETLVQMKEMFSSYTYPDEEVCLSFFRKNGKV